MYTAPISARIGAAKRKRTVTVSSIELHQDLRNAVGELCRRFPDTYWRELDADRAYPEEFVKCVPRPHRDRLPGKTTEEDLGGQIISDQSAVVGLES